MEQESIKITIIIFYITFFLFIGGMIIFIREYLKKKQLHTQELKKIDELHKKELIQTQAEIQKETMRHIGREIHDNVGQKLTLSSLYLQQLVFENKVPQVANTINSINEIINESLYELRSLSKSLTDDTIENNSLSALIEEECKKTKGLQVYDIEFYDHSEALALSYQMKSILLRITQEFIQNSIKHAHCKKIEINLSNTSTQLQLQLMDDGKGFDIKNLKTKGIGLQNMKKRTEIINGVFLLESEPKTGTRLTLKIPM